MIGLAWKVEYGRGSDWLEPVLLPIDQILKQTVAEGQLGIKITIIIIMSL